MPSYGFFFFFLMSCNCTINIEKRETYRGKQNVRGFDITMNDRLGLCMKMIQTSSSPNRDFDSCSPTWLLAFFCYSGKACSQIGFFEIMRKIANTYRLYEISFTFLSLMESSLLDAYLLITDLLNSP